MAPLAAATAPGMLEGGVGMWPARSAFARLAALAAATPRIGLVARQLSGLLARDHDQRPLANNRAFRDLVEGLPHQLWAARPDGYHDYFNERVLEYTGLTLDGLSGTRAFRQIHPDDHPTLWSRYGRSLATGLPYEIEYRIRGGEHGEYRWFLGRAVPLRDDTQTIVRWIGTCTDIHEHKLAQARLVNDLEHEQRTRGRLADELRLSETFTGVLGHDLRSPLTAIAANASLLGEELTVDEARATGRRIATSARRMGRMIEQLLDLARVRAGGGLAIDRAPMELAAVCLEVIGELERTQRRSAIALNVVGDTRGAWDAVRLAQVVSNLLGNAVRHGEPGCIETTLDGRAADEVVLVVHNRGAIPPALMPHLFDPYRQGHESREGLGLGLFIVKQIVEAHDGTVVVCSSKAAGTSFHVRLPRALSTSPVVALGSRESR
jgi:PAS domain S-box-containing protein